MCVHFGKTRHEEAIGTVNHKRTLRHRHRIDISHSDYLAVSDDKCLLCQDDVAGHRQDIDIDKDSKGICRNCG